MEYLPTNLPQYVKQTSRSELANSVVESGHVLLFSEDGESLTAKLPDGSFVDVGGSAGGSVVDAALVTEYIPYRAAFTAASSYEVSGFGATEYGSDYSAYNGTYEVTPETQYKTGLERIYKHTTQNYYLVGFIDEMDIGGPAWGFANSPSVSYAWGAVAAKSGSTPESGNWMNYDMYQTMSLTLTGTNTTYPEQPLVLNGKIATDYIADKRFWQLPASSSALSGHQTTPIAGEVYCAKSGSLIGTRSVDRYTTGKPERSIDSNTLLYIPCGAPLLDRSFYNHPLTLSGGSLSTITQADLYTSSELPSGVSPSSVIWTVGGESAPESGGSPLTNDGFLQRWNFAGGSIVVSPLDREFAVGTGDLTLEAYIYPVYVEATQFVFAFSNTFDMMLDLGSNGQLYIWDARTYHYSVASITFGKWIHIAVVRSSGTVTVYVNGVSSYTGTSTASIGTDAAVHIGIPKTDSGQSHAAWQGKMADIRFSRAARYAADFTPLTYYAAVEA